MVARRSQEEQGAGGARMRQDAQGASKRSHEQPGGANRDK